MKERKKDKINSGKIELEPNDYRIVSSPQLISFIPLSRKILPTLSYT